VTRLLFLAWLVVTAGPVLDRASAQNACPAPHGRLISVDHDVSIEVVEWSRTGQPLVFLSGLSKTAHAFDNFAPRFADQYRVVGITRRGWGRSSHTLALSYDSAHLVEDILTVMDSLALPAAHLVGWSYGGDEAMLLATQHPDRVLSVTLLDSYDNSPAAQTFAISDSLPVPKELSPRRPKDLVEVMQRQRVLGFPDPVSEVCATSRFTTAGRYVGPVSSDSVVEHTWHGAARLAYSAVSRPLLAIYGTKHRLGDVFPTVAVMDSADRARAVLVTATFERELGAARLRLRRALPSAHILEIPGANHAIFRSHPDRVFRAMQEFLAGVGAGH
jgi:non-heme chloroperoxidase